MEIQTLEQIKDRYYGQKGTQERDRIERELHALRIGLKIRNMRKKKSMTQSELAEKINKKRSFISKLENDGTNMTIKTLFDIVEYGLGGKLQIDVSI
jgi:DNA-binding XRE family transcriptional regulator